MNHYSSNCFQLHFCYEQSTDKLNLYDFFNKERAINERKIQIVTSQGMIKFKSLNNPNTAAYAMFQMKAVLMNFILREKNIRKFIFSSSFKVTINY